MGKFVFLLGVAPFALSVPALADTAASGAEAALVAPSGRAAKVAPATTAPAKDVFSTGVARGRDILDAAISTSALKESEIQKLGAQTLSDIMRDIPGIRIDPGVGEGNGNYTIRGLPLASTGSKFMQLQEDGLPVMEFGDIFQATPDIFMRADFNLAAVEALRGGSASTFASNSPGGVINLISKTGDSPGGAIQESEGLNYAEHRIDFDYGDKLTDTVRYHIGGFYRQGVGPDHIGFDAYRGGQLKFNVTKQFDTGFVRLYVKLLDDHTPQYAGELLAVSGSDAHPVFTNVPGIDLRTDAYMSPNISAITFMDAQNHVATKNAESGQHSTAKTVGFEAQFDVGNWTVSDKFRFAALSADILGADPLAGLPAAYLAQAIAGPSAKLTYATGPNAGMLIANPATLNGNGLAVESDLIDQNYPSLNNLTNDFRLNRAWKIAGGALTMTAGFYKSRQTMDMDWSQETVLSDAVGGGKGALLNLATASGLQITQNGALAYGQPLPNGLYHRGFAVTYDVNAPYGSLNYHIGKLAIGGSLRYDTGRARGSLYGGELGGGRVGSEAYDINGDGVISIPEMNVAILPLSMPAPVNYDYHYLSYSVGVNYRIANSLAVFGRYSKGGRAAADRILFANLLNTNGSLIDPKDAYNPVRQGELGVKFRTGNLSLNVTAFQAKAGDLNTQIVTFPDGSTGLQQIVRTYSAKGIELESAIRHGHFSLTAGATYTKAKIATDEFNPSVVGNTPRNQPDLIFQATPQYSCDKFSVGATIMGITGVYAQDTDQLRIPAYTTVNLFLQIRPIRRVQLALNVNNLFDTLAITDVTQGTLPPTGIVTANSIIGRIITTSVRLEL